MLLGTLQKQKNDLVDGLLRYKQLSITSIKNLEEKEMTAPYLQSEWNDYAESHLSVLPSLQLNMYKSVAACLTGNVADFGCGTARITPFLADKENVSAYIGVDYSEDMVKKACWLIDQLSVDNYHIKYSKIENVECGGFDSALSINSYYTWDDSSQMLAHIHTLLKPNASFILVTPNRKMDMEKLAKEADKELIGHPHYPIFRKTNLQLAGNEQALFVEMNNLIQQVTSVGFQVVSCHQEFYLGGLNFLHLKA